MRRWNRLVLVALLAAVLIPPSGALATPSTSSSTSFTGKAVAKNSQTHYFVVAFTCSGGTLSGSWTYRVTRTRSYSGSLGSAHCILFSPDGGRTWRTSLVDTCALLLLVPPLTVPLLYRGTNVGRLSLCLTDVGVHPHHHFFPNTTLSCPTPPHACMEVTTSALSLAHAPPLSSLDAGYATLDLWVGRSSRSRRRNAVSADSAPGASPGEESFRCIALASCRSSLQTP